MSRRSVREVSEGGGRVHHRLVGLDVRAWSFVIPQLAHVHAVGIVRRAECGHDHQLGGDRKIHVAGGLDNAGFVEAPRDERLPKMLSELLVASDQRLGALRIYTLDPEQRAAAVKTYLLEHTERAPEIPELAYRYAEQMMLRAYLRWHDEQEWLPSIGLSAERWGIHGLYVPEVPIDIDAEATRLRAVTVTATRTPTRVFETPQHVTVIDSTELRELLIDTPVDVMRDLPGLLRAGDLLVFNDTRVIPARLHGHKDSGGRVESVFEPNGFKARIEFPAAPGH